jgi:hypothetical protein
VTAPFLAQPKQSSRKLAALTHRQAVVNDIDFSSPRFAFF